MLLSELLLLRQVQKTFKERVQLSEVHSKWRYPPLWRPPNANGGLRFSILIKNSKIFWSRQKYQNMRQILNKLYDWKMLLQEGIWNAIFRTVKILNWNQKTLQYSFVRLQNICYNDRSLDGLFVSFEQYMKSFFGVHKLMWHSGLCGRFQHQRSTIRIQSFLY